MKIIDLLNKIANGEEVPKKLKYDDDIYEYDYNEKNYAYFFIDHYSYLFNGDIMQILDDEVEILEEEKKIPEKLNWKPKESMAGELTQKEQIEVIARRTEKLKKEFNNLLDYLKSKGE